MARHGIEPAQLVLQYTIPADGSGSSIVIVDLARDLSAVNRRLYRQGYTYAVGKVSFNQVAPKTNTILLAQTAGNTWMIHNAWKKGYALWRSQINEVLDVMPGTEGKWADFKVKLDDSGATYLSCIASDGGAMASDEWNFSEYVWDDDGTERKPPFHLIGATDLTSSIGLVQEYHISRAQQGAEPVISSDQSDSIYAKSLGTDEMSDMLIDNLESENDLAPYDASEMVGGDTVADSPWIQAYAFSNTDAGQQGRLEGFAAECGLIKFQAISVSAADGTTAAATEVLLFVHLVPGPYRGVLAERMGQ